MPPNLPTNQLPYQIVTSTASLADRLRLLADECPADRTWFAVIEMFLDHAATRMDWWPDTSLSDELKSALLNVIIEFTSTRLASYASREVLVTAASKLDDLAMAPEDEARLANRIAHDLDLAGRPSLALLAGETWTCERGRLAPRLLERDMRGIAEDGLSTHPAHHQRAGPGRTHRWHIAGEWAGPCDVIVDFGLAESIRQLGQLMTSENGAAIRVVQPIAGDRFNQEVTTIEASDRIAILGPGPTSPVRARLLDGLATTKKHDVVVVPEYCVPQDLRKEAVEAVRRAGAILAVLGTSLTCTCQPTTPDDWSQLSLGEDACSANALVVLNEHRFVVAKHIPAMLDRMRGVRESILDEKPEVRILAGALPEQTDAFDVEAHPHEPPTSPWAVCVLVCRDALEPDVREALEAVGAAVVIVPMMSTKTAVARGFLHSISVTSQAVTVLANGGPARDDGPSSAVVVFRPTEANVEATPGPSNEPGTALFDVGSGGTQWVPA